jgi:CBS domain-containing protein
MKVGDICKRQVVVANASTTLQEVAQKMRTNHIGTVVVVDDKDARRPVGIVTDRDLVLEVIAPGLDARTITAGDVMTTSPAVARKDDDALWALKTLRDRGVRRLPVVDESGALAGIISLDDLMEHVCGALSDIVQALGTERSVEAWRRA